MGSVFGGSQPAGSTTVNTTSTSAPTSQGQKGINTAFGGANNIYAQNPYQYLNAAVTAPLNAYSANSLGDLYNIGTNNNAGGIASVFGGSASPIANLEAGGGGGYTGGAYQAGLGAAADLASGGGGGYAGGAYQQGLQGAAGLAMGGGGGQTGNAYAQSLGGIGALASNDNLSPASSTFGAANDNLQKTIAGNYLSPSNNPGLQSVISQSLASALPAAQGSFTGGSRNDSGLASLAQAQAANNTVGNIEYGNYQTERQNQLNADQQASAALLGQQGVQAQGVNLGLNAQGVQNSAIQAGSSLGLQGMGLQNEALQAGAGLGLQGQQLQNNAQATGAQLAGQAYGNVLGGLGAAAGAGTQLQNYDQLAASNQLANQNLQTLAPTQNLQAYEQALQGSGALNYGQNVGAQSTPYFENQGANLLSGGLGALGLAGGVSNLLGYGGLSGIGSGIGGLLGAGGGLFSGAGAAGGIGDLFSMAAFA